MPRYRFQSNWVCALQANEVAAGGAARMNFTDHDIVDFLVRSVLMQCIENPCAIV